MQKNNMMRLASVLLIAVLLSTCAVSGTFAKYTTTQLAESKARVAKWDIDFNAGDQQSKNFVFNLFDTVNDNYENAATQVPEKEGDVTQPTDVAENTPAIIAPGTSGSFTINLRNDSEVSAKYAISFEANNTSNIPLQFKTDKISSDWTPNINEINISAEDNQKLKTGTETTQVTVYWRWLYERKDDNGSTDSADSADTDLGTSRDSNGNTPTITVTATVTVTQVD